MNEKVKIQNKRLDDLNGDLEMAKQRTKNSTMKILN